MLSRMTSGPGLYRVRASMCDALVYLGQTGRNLRQRLMQLQRGTFLEGSMPFNDPHTAAPNLWVWRNEGIGAYECSIVELNGDKQLRQVTEDYLLWLARVEAGCSTLCNHGKFHPGYIKPSNRKQGRIGERIRSISISISEFSKADAPPLLYRPNPLSQDWMTLQWSSPERLVSENIKKLESQNGVYKLIDGRVDEVIYIGESSAIKNRLISHIKPMSMEWGTELLYSYVYLAHDATAVQRHQLEVDLIGGFYHQFKMPPKRQYKPLQ